MINSPERAHSSFEITCVFKLIVFGNVFQILSAKFLKRLNRQINWGINVCYLRKKYDKARDLLKQSNISRPEKYKSFYGYLSLHQNTRTKLFKIIQNVKTRFGVNLIVRQCAQKENELPQ